MLLTHQTANERLNSPDNLVNRFARPCDPSTVNVKEIAIRRPGQIKDKPQLPQFLRTSIAILARSGADSQKSLAEQFNTTQPNVSEIKTGHTKRIDEERVELALGQVRDIALEKLMQSMGMIDEDKLAKCKAGELSNVAANMSKIVEKTIPQKRDDSSGVTLVVYAPEIRQEKTFTVIDV